MKATKGRDLREACVAEALAIIGEVGVEGLSIREVARRLGVSHQAPYKHFESSDHLLAEIVRRTYAQFSQHLEDRPRHPSPADDMRTLGEAYFRFAMEHPLHYRLMFGTPLPDPAAHPEMMHEARRAFLILQEQIGRLHGRAAGEPLAADSRDALFVWATVHGLATIMRSPVLSELGLEPGILADALPHTLACIGRAMGAPASGSAC